MNPVVASCSSVVHLPNVRGGTVLGATVKFLENESGAVNLVLKTRDFPGDDLTTNNTSSVTKSSKQVHVRARTRQAVLRIESDDDNTSGNTATGWRLGATRLDVRTDGRR